MAGAAAPGVDVATSASVVAGSVRMRPGQAHSPQPTAHWQGAEMALTVTSVGLVRSIPCSRQFAGLPEVQMQHALCAIEWCEVTTNPVWRSTDETYSCRIGPRRESVRANILIPPKTVDTVARWPCTILMRTAVRALDSACAVEGPCRESFVLLSAGAAKKRHDDRIFGRRFL